MRVIPFVLSSLVIAPSALLLQGEQGRHAPDVGRMFKEQCISCHQPPDPQFQIDRAWLHQVFDTT